MIYLILLGLFQALMLPGLILSYYVREISSIDRIIIASFLSLVINYLLVGSLFLSGFYTQWSLVIVMLIETLLLCYLRKQINIDIKILVNKALSILKDIFHLKYLDFYKIAFLMYFFVYIYLYKDSFMSVFTLFDSVVSWNRWAVEWFSGEFYASYGYPQAFPMLLSLVYKMANETNIQSFSKLICAFWPLLGGTAILVCGLHLPKYKKIFAVTAYSYLYMFTYPAIDFTFSGYVDPIMAAYGAGFLYGATLIISNTKKNNLEFKKLIFLISIAISGGALVKITGVILVAIFCSGILWYLSTLKLLKYNKRYYVCTTIAVLIISLHWYIWNYLYRNDFPLAAYNSMQDLRLWMRPFNYALSFEKAFGWIYCTFILIGLSTSWICQTMFLLLVLPLFLFCSVIAGYDLRAAFVIFAPLSYIGSVGMVYIWNRLIMPSLVLIRFYERKLHSRVNFNNISVLFLIMVFAIMPFKLTKQRILAHNTRLRVASNDIGFNQRILDIFQSDPHAKIISCVQMPYALPGAPGKYYAVGDCSINTVKTWISTADIKYFLHWQPERKYPSIESIRARLGKQNIKFHEELLVPGYILLSKTT